MTKPAYDLPADPVTTAPTLSDVHGRAWRITPAGKDLSRSMIDGWIIEAPWAHPVWHSYVILLIHLRGVPGEAAPKIYVPDATHEFGLFALDPSKPRQPMIDSGNIEWLEPGNFAAQITAAADDLAMTHIYCAVMEIIRGRLSPDTDFVRTWVALFGDGMVQEDYFDGSLNGMEVDE